MADVPENIVDQANVTSGRDTVQDAECNVQTPGRTCASNGNGNEVSSAALRRSPRLKAKSALEALSSKDKEVLPEEDEDEDVVVKVPEVGMVFDTMLEVEAFYKMYAFSQGFGVIRAAGSSNSKKLRRATIWKCECEGDPDQKSKRICKSRAKHPDRPIDISKELGQVRKRQSKKCHCEAMLRATVNEVNQWVIRKVVLEHKDHEPIPAMAHLVKEYRMKFFTPSVARKLFNDNAQGVPVPKIRACVANERGGYENFPVTENDMRHELHARRKLKMEGGDSNALVEYFNLMQKQNRDFFHCHRLDSEGKMKDILWVDPRSREAFKEFSDVVCFDTTYLTNMYALPFANFVGVNHHGQTILFGCALITNEDCDTFQWVFSKWLEAMDGRAPKAILTDQAAAMRRPLEETMPDTRHRWCIWHILQKLPYKFANLKSYSNFKDDLLDVVYNSVNEAEFERRWREVVVKYGVESNEWLTNLFEERRMWVPSFMTDCFWAGMRSTQRVESIHSFFDEFLSRDTPFCEFGEKYIAAVEKRVADEKYCDDKSTKWAYNYITGYNAERFFRKIYTAKIFKAIQRQCEAVTYVAIEEQKSIDGNTVDYLMEDRVWVLSKKRSKFTLTDRHRFHNVLFDRTTKMATCSCKMFETDGIMCRHLIRLYDKLHIDDIPESFILRRWRKDVIRKHTSIRVSHHDLSRTEDVKRLDRLLLAFESVTDLATKSEKCTKIVLRALKLIESEVREALPQEQVTSQAESNIADEAGSLGTGTNQVNSGMENSMPPISSSLARNNVSPGIGSQASETAGCGTPSTVQSGRVEIKDPKIPKKRGRPRSTRFKSFSETGWQGSQPCNPESNNDHVSNGSTSKGKCKSKAKGKAPDKQKNIEGVHICHVSLEWAGCGAVSGAEKLPVKRRKTVSFVDPDVDASNGLQTAQDDLLNRNMLAFSDTILGIEDEHGLDSQNI